MLEQALIWILLAVAGAAVQRVSDIVFGESVEKLIYSLLIRRRVAPVDLAGRWHSSFEYISDDDGRVIIAQRTLRISQRGKRVVVKDPGDQERTRVRLHGILSANGVFSGEWEERSLAGRQYHGVFQFLLARTGSEMRGKWVSYGREDVVQSGDWLLRRQTTAQPEP